MTGRLNGQGETQLNFLGALSRYAHPLI